MEGLINGKETVFFLAPTRVVYDSIKVDEQLIHADYLRSIFTLKVIL